jgi:hypothetical protein
MNDKFKLFSNEELKIIYSYTSYDVSALNHEYEKGRISKNMFDAEINMMLEVRKEMLDRGIHKQSKEYIELKERKSNL